MNTYLNKIRIMCQEYPIHPKLLIIPSMIMQNSILKTLNDKGISPINLEMTTVSSVAINLAEMSLSKDGLILLKDTDVVEIVRMAFEKLDKGKQLNYFNKSEATKGLYKVLASTIIEIKHGGWKQNLVNLDLIENEHKRNDIINMMNCYNNLLKELGFVDNADIIEIACEFLEKRSTYKEIHLLEGCSLTYIEEKFIQKMGWKKTDKDDLYLTDCKESVSSIANISLKKTYGIHLEVKEVIRTIFKEKLPFDKVLIVGMSNSPYSDVLYKLFSQYTKNNEEIAQEKQMPITFESGISATITSPVKLALALLDWIESGYALHGLIRIFTDGAMSLDKLKEADEDILISRSSLVQVLLDSNITWQRSTYEFNLEELSEKSNKYKGLALELSHFIKNEIFNVIPETDIDGLIDLEVFLEGIKTFVSRNTVIKSKKDKQALFKINEELFTAIKGIKLSLDEVVSDVRNQLYSLQVDEQSATEGKIHFTTVRGAEWIPRKYIFLVGNDANTFFKNRNEDPVLLDKERNNTLKKSTEKQTDDLKAINRFLLSIKNPLIASYSYFDTNKNRDSFPSLIFMAMQEKMGENSKLQTIDLALDNIKDAFDVEDYVITKSVGQNYLMENLDEREKEDLEEIEDSNFHIYNEKFDPRKNAVVLSASMLQTYLECEYRYFLKYILKLKEISSTELDKLGWISPLEIGKLYHSIFEIFMKQTLSDQGILYSQEKSVETIEKIANDIIEIYEKRLPVASEYHTNKEKKEILKNSRIFAINEVNQRNYSIPLDFEFEFGKLEHMKIDLPDASSIAITGIIDRMDKMVEDNSIRIIDYKTGSTFGYDVLKNSESNLINSKSIQPLLYFLALDSLGVKPVKSALYVFVTSKGGYETFEISFEYLKPEEIKYELIKLLDKMSTGVFNVVEDDFKCRYCSYSEVCKRQEVKSQ